MRYEFGAIIGLEEDASSLLQHWPEWKDKLTALARTESSTRPKLATVVKQLDKSEEMTSADDKAVYTCRFHAYEVNSV